MLPTDHLPSLGEALADAMLAHRSRTALIEVDRHTEVRRLRYADVAREAAAVCAGLRERGVQPGDRVAIVLSNQSRWLTAATGIFWAGATLVPVDYKAQPDDQAAILAHAEPTLVLTEWPVWRALVETDAGGVLEDRAVVAHAPERVSLGEANRWESTFSLVDGVPVPAAQGRDDVACIVYSSGTGGDVKGCMLTHGNYLAQAQSLGRLYPMEPGERFFSILPTNHAIDFMTGFFMPFCFGATVVHQRSLRPEFLRFVLKRYGITHIAAVPRILRAFDEKIRDRVDSLAPGRKAISDGLVRLNELLTQRRPNHAISSRLLAPFHAGFGGKLRYVFAGGAFVDPELARSFYRLGIPVVIGYGLTEAGTVLTVNDGHPFRPDTVGPPVDGVRIEIREAGTDGVGEVWAAGPTVMKGYFRNDALTAETIVDGWLRTGDMGYFDAAGHLKLVGRARNMIVTEGGKNIYPEDIESAFEGVEGLEELCVFAANFVWPQAGMQGEELVLVVRPEDGAADWQAAVRACNQRLAEYKRVHRVLVIAEEFPRTASLKVKRKHLAEWLRENTQRDACVSIAPSLESETA